MIKKLLLLSLICSSAIAMAQETDLFDLLDEDTSGSTVGASKVVYATFKGTQLINAATNETPGKGVLQYVIATGLVVLVTNTSIISSV